MSLESASVALRCIGGVIVAENLDILNGAGVPMHQVANRWLPAPGMRHPYASATSN